jgi:hypothetical protein
MKIHNFIRNDQNETSGFSLEKKLVLNNKMNFFLQ